VTPPLWLPGVVKTYDVRRRCGVLTPMMSDRYGVRYPFDGGKDVHFSAKCVEGDEPVKVGCYVYFQDFVFGERRTARVVMYKDCEGRHTSSEEDD
jgi:hypothetical protein